MSEPIPVGTIIAYGGDFSPANVTYLSSIGWLPCDGRSYKKQSQLQLALAIGTSYGGTGGLSGSFNVPDLRGRFVRGVSWGSGNDPDAAKRIVANPGGNAGDDVGSLQAGATGVPTTPFTTSQDGLHSHNIPNLPVNNNAYALIGGHYALWNDGSRNLGAAGEHTHQMASGFDAESRPINTYVNFVIAAQPVAS